MVGDLASRCVVWGATTQDDNARTYVRGPLGDRVTGLNFIYRADKSACYRGVLVARS